MPTQNYPTVKGDWIGICAQTLYCPRLGCLQHGLGSVHRRCTVHVMGVPSLAWDLCTDAVLSTSWVSPAWLGTCAQTLYCHTQMLYCAHHGCSQLGLVPVPRRYTVHIMDVSEAMVL